MAYCTICKKEVEPVGKRKNNCPICKSFVSKKKPSKDGVKSAKTLQKYPDTHASKTLDFDGKTLAILEDLQHKENEEDINIIIKKAINAYSPDPNNPTNIKNPVEKLKEALMMAQLTKEINEVSANQNNPPPTGPEKIVKQLQEAEMSKEVLDIYRNKDKGKEATEDEMDKLEKSMAKQIRMKQMKKMLEGGEDLDLKELMKIQMFKQMFSPNQGQNNHQDTQLQALMQEIRDMKREQSHQQDKQMMQQNFNNQLQALQTNTKNPILDVMQESHKQQQDRQMQHQTEKEKMQMELSLKERAIQE